MTATTTSKNYVDNKTLTTALAAWSDECRRCDADNTPRPPLPDVVGETALLMARKLASKWNFSQYTFREDMISDSVLAVVKYAHNFDGSKSQNGFAYITTLLSNAFIRNIQSEKHQTYTKAKMLEESGLIHSMPHVKESGDELIRDYENYKAKKTERLKIARDSRAT